MAKSQGAQANLTGTRMENHIELSLLDCGYVKLAEKYALVNDIKSLTQPSYARQVQIGKTIYGTNLKSDFVLFHPDKWPEGLVIEVKWQQRGGTVDEKFPYLVMNIWSSEYQTILILDGGGYRDGAERWIRSMQKQNLLHVFNMVEFLTWVNQGNL